MQKKREAWNIKTMVFGLVLVIALLAGLYSLRAKPVGEFQQAYEAGVGSSRNSLADAMSFQGVDIVPLSNQPIDSKRQNKEIEYLGFVIELDQLSLIAFKKEIENKGIAGNINGLLADHKDRIINIHNSIKSEINSILPKAKIKHEYFKVFNGLSIDATDEDINKIKQLDFVKNIYPNYKITTFLMDSVPLINADDVWHLQDSQGRNITGQNITIAIIDTGVDYTHIDLGGCLGEDCKVAGGYDFINNDNDPMDDHGHGTHVAGIAAGNGALRGVAPDARIYAYKVLDSGGSGTWDEVISGIERAIDPNNDDDYSDRADVISMSIGSGGCVGTPDDPPSIAADNAVIAGSVVVIAAGNCGSDYGTIATPGNSRKAITVGASDKQDFIADFSSRGPTTTLLTVKPDVVAPGVSICSAQWDSAWNWLECIDEHHVSISGTSMATPHVSGAAALIKQAHPDWTPDEIKYALRATAIDIGLGLDILTQGYGRIDVLRAVSLTRTPIVAMLNTSGLISGSINITGFINTENFSYYRLDYGEGINPVFWNTIIESSILPNDAILYENWDTSQLDDAIYSLRLTVYTIFNETGEDMSLFVVSNNPDKEFYCSGCLECRIFANIPGSKIRLTQDISSSGNCIVTDKDNISINCQGYTITGNSNGYGINSYLPFVHNKNLKIDQCNIENFYYGVKFAYTDNSVLQNNNLYFNLYGLISWMSKNVTLKNNSFFNNTGISLLIYGLRDPSLLNHSIDYSNTVDGFPVHYFFDISNTEFTGLQSGHLQLSYSENVTILNSLVKGDGIILSDTKNVTIFNNIIENVSAESGIHIGYYSFLNTVRNKDYKIINNRFSKNASAWSYGIVLRDYNFTSEYERRIENNTIINQNFPYGRGMFINGYKVKIIGNNVSAYCCGFDGFVKEAHLEYNSFVSSSDVALSFYPFGYPFDSLVTRNVIISPNFDVVTHNAPAQLSLNRSGNFWGRSSAPYFCEYGNQNQSCINNWDSDSSVAKDICPYNRAYARGQWPSVSPTCRGKRSLPYEQYGEGI